MELTKGFLEPLPILSEGEIFFLKTILPILLALPWVIAILFLLLRWFLTWIASLKPKQVITKTVNSDDVEIYHFFEEPLKRLSEIEELAKTNPRLAIIELSKYIRGKNIKGEFEKVSLEYYLKKNNKTPFAPWTDILTNPKVKLEAPKDLYAEIVFSSYQLNEPKLETALSYIQRVRSLKTKGKQK